MHLEATAVDLGGKLTSGKPYWRDFGPSLAILWVMLKLSRAMVGHVKAICQILFGHVVGFVSQSAPPQKHQDFKWVLASYVLSDFNLSIWGQIGAKLGHLGPCEGIWRLQLFFLGRSWGILRASWAIRRSC